MSEQFTPEPDGLVSRYEDGTMRMRHNAIDHASEMPLDGFSPADVKYTCVTCGTWAAIPHELAGTTDFRSIGAKDADSH